MSWQSCHLREAVVRIAMRTRVTIEEAQRRLKELIAALKPDDEVIITRDDKEVARLLPIKNSDNPSLRTMSLPG